MCWCTCAAAHLWGVKILSFISRHDDDGHKRRSELWFMISFFARYTYIEKFSRVNRERKSFCVCTRGGIDKSLTHKYLNPITFIAFFLSLSTSICLYLFSIHSFYRSVSIALLASYLIFHFQTLVWRERMLVRCMADLSTQMRVQAFLFLNE